MFEWFTGVPKTYDKDSDSDEEWKKFEKEIDDKVKASLGEGAEDMDEGAFLQRMHEMEMNIRAQQRANRISKWFHIVFFGLAMMFMCCLAGKFMLSGIWVHVDRCKVEKYAHLCDYCMGPYGDHMLCYGHSMRDSTVRQ